MIESILSSVSDEVYLLNGLVTAVAGSSNINISIANFNTILCRGATIAFITDAGTPEYHIISTIVDDNNATTMHAIRSVASGGATNICYRIKHCSPWIFINPTLTHDFIRNADFDGASICTGDVKADMCLKVGTGIHTPAGYRYKFNYNEITRINSITVKSPFQFVKAYGPLYIRFYQYQNLGVGDWLIDTIGENGAVNVGDFNETLSFNKTIVRVPITLNSQWAIQPEMWGYAKSWYTGDDYDFTSTVFGVTSSQKNRISYVNAPLILHWRPFPITILMNITHGTTLLP